MSFPTTHWSLIAAATLNGDEAGRAALNELCRRYRGPVLGFFRSKLPSAEDAEDLTQSLFNQMLEKRIWLRADAAKGRFRSFLLTVASNAWHHWRKAAAAAKRGGTDARLSLDLLSQSGWEAAAPDDDGALVFDREWADTVMAAAWSRVEKAATATPETAARFAVLRRFLPGRDPPPTYEAAAAELGIRADHVKTLIHRLRQDFRTALCREVADTLAAGDDLDGEMNHLSRVMSAGPGEPFCASTIILKHSGTKGPMDR
jgi:RNA polymerase sigma-70 factor (ECF subfamily)